MHTPKPPFCHEVVSKVTLHGRSQVWTFSDRCPLVIAGASLRCTRLLFLSVQAGEQVGKPHSDHLLVGSGRREYQSSPCTLQIVFLLGLSLDRVVTYLQSFEKQCEA